MNSVRKPVGANGEHFDASDRSSSPRRDCDPSVPTPLLLTLDQITVYDRNPRQEPNEAYEELKHSLRQRGFRGVLPVTRRPRAAQYMVAEGGNTTFQILQELYAETRDETYFKIHCLFEPWISESNTLLAHLSENDSRGSLLFIDRARSICALRDLLQSELGYPISGREFIKILRDRGYIIDQSYWVKMEYAINHLESVIPLAFRAGMGVRSVERIRKLERNIEVYLAHRNCSPAVIESGRRWFLQCLSRHDGQELSALLETIVEREIAGYLASQCNVGISLVRADLGFIDATGTSGSDLPGDEQQESSDATGDLNESKRPSPIAPSASQETAEIRPPPNRASVASVQRNNAIPAVMKSVTAARSTDVKSLRGRLWTLAWRLGQHHGIGDCVAAKPGIGAGYYLDLPELPLFEGEEPDGAEDATRCTLWWTLVALADVLPYGFGDAPAAAHLESARIHPFIAAVSNGDPEVARRLSEPSVGQPPALEQVSRQLIGRLDERDYRTLLELIETRRALEMERQRRGMRTVWDL